MTEFKLGQTVLANGWPAIVIGISPNPRICLAVFGWELDMGDVWRRDCSPLDETEARNMVLREGHNVSRFDDLLKQYKKKQDAKDRAKAKKLG